MEGFLQRANASLTPRHKDRKPGHNSDDSDDGWGSGGDEPSARLFTAASYEAEEKASAKPQAAAEAEADPSASPGSIGSANSKKSPASVGASVGVSQDRMQAQTRMVSELRGLMDEVRE